MGAGDEELEITKELVDEVMLAGDTKTVTVGVITGLEDVTGPGIILDSLSDALGRRFPWRTRPTGVLRWTMA